MHEKKAMNKWQMLLAVAVGLILAKATWFSATAITPELAKLWEINENTQGWFANMVQIGFVLGVVLGSLVNLPDLVRLNRLIGICALLAALSNMVLLLEPSLSWVMISRFVTGFVLGGVYPPAMKLIATWFVRGRGFAISVVVGALTLGAAMPHLFRTVLGDGVNWHMVVMASSVSSAIGGLIYLFFISEGPHPFAKAVFDPRQSFVALKNRALLLATCGYLGHMWELYAMWAWLLAFVQAALMTQNITSIEAVSGLTFVGVGAGALGCLLGGYISDRKGRTFATLCMLLTSGLCCLLIGFLFAGPFVLFAVVIFVWGVSVVGDSAQFSTCVTELSDQRYVGTVLSLQVALGFLLSSFVIWVLPYVAEFLGGWRWVPLFFAPGPFLGAYAMWRLRQHPDAVKLAHGLR